MYCVDLLFINKTRNQKNLKEIEEETLITKMNILREERNSNVNGPMVKLNIELKSEYF